MILYQKYKVDLHEKQDANGKNQTIIAQVHQTILLNSELCNENFFFLKWLRNENTLP